MKLVRLIAIVAVVIAIGLLLEKRRHVAASGRNHGVRVGSLNGQPLYVPTWNAAARFALQHDRPPNSPADQKEVADIAQSQVCASIKSQIEVAARAAAQREFHLSVSHDEVAKVISNTHYSDTSEQQRKQWIAENQAAVEVFDQHHDPEKVFREVYLPAWQGPPEMAHKVWESRLIVWSSPEQRTRLARMAANANKWNPETVKEGMAKDMEHMLLSQKLDEAVIADLATKDPQFHTYLEEHQKQGGLPLTLGVPITTPGLQYISDKINEFWRSRYAQQRVTLDDPKLASQCQLAAFGVKVN